MNIFPDPVAEISLEHASGDGTASHQESSFSGNDGYVKYQSNDQTSQ